MIGQQKNNVTLYCQNQDLIEKHVITLKNPYAYQNYLGIFEKYKRSGIAFFLQSSRCVFNEQSCLTTTGPYDDLLLLSSLVHFYYFMFSAPISFSLCSPISSSLLFSSDVLSQAFIKGTRKAFVYLYIYIQIHIIYILENVYIFA